jgi:hypothetical protein
VALVLAAGFGWRRDADDEAEEAPAKPAKKAAKDDEEAEQDVEEPAERRSFVSLGRLYHFGYSIKARLVLLPSMLVRPAVAPDARASCHCGAIRRR